MGKILPFRKPRRVKPTRFANRRRRMRWKGWIWPLVLTGLLVAAWQLTAPLVAPEWDQVESRQFGLCGERGRPFACVTDGDTVILGYGKAARRIRLTGFDAPELKGACPAESAKAQEARIALQRWLNSGPFEWDGGAEPPYDRYGRELRSVRRVSADGQVEELADAMIDAGLANADDWGLTATDWCG